MARRVLLAGVIAAIASGCGGASDDEPPKPLGKTIGGSVAPLANCRDWAGGARERKLATIADIRNQVSRTDTGVKSPPLSNSEAMRLFDGECAKPYARTSRLYVIYARAAGWAPLLRD